MVPHSPVLGGTDKTALAQVILLPSFFKTKLIRPSGALASCSREMALLVGVALLAGSVSVPEDCSSLGFTENLACSTCAQMQEFVKNDQVQVSASRLRGAIL